MKIHKYGNTHIASVGDLKSGEIFSHEGDIFIKIIPINDITAICMEDGEPRVFGLAMKVYRFEEDEYEFRVNL